MHRCTDSTRQICLGNIIFLYSGIFQNKLKQTKEIYHQTNHLPRKHNKLFAAEFKTFF